MDTHIHNAERVLGALRKLNHLIAILVGVALLGCALLVLADIVLRQMGRSFGGTDEISGYVMAVTAAWGMAYAMLELAHVRIDFLRAKLAQRLRCLFDLCAMLALAGTVSVIAIQCWPVLAKSMANSSRANTPLETPLWLVQWPWMAGWAWFALMAWATFAAAVFLFAKDQLDQAEKTIGAFGEESREQ